MKGVKITHQIGAKMADIHDYKQRGYLVWHGILIDPRAFMGAGHISMLKPEPPPSKNTPVTDITQFLPRRTDE